MSWSSVLCLVVSLLYSDSVSVSSSVLRICFLFPRYPPASRVLPLPARALRFVLIPDRIKFTPGFAWRSACPCNIASLTQPNGLKGPVELMKEESVGTECIMCRPSHWETKVEHPTTTLFRRLTT